MFSLREWIENKEQRTLHYENEERLRVEKEKEEKEHELKQLHSTESYKAEQWKKDILNGK